MACGVCCLFVGMGMYCHVLNEVAYNIKQVITAESQQAEARFTESTENNINT